MTAEPAVLWRDVPAPVCDRCRRPHPHLTITIMHGRRCPACPPAYDRGHALACAHGGRFGGAFAHLRTALACYPPAPAGAP